MATARSAVMVLRKDLEMVTAKVSDLESEKTTLQKEFKTSTKTQAETEAGHAKDPGKTRDDLGKKTRECGALRAKSGKLEKGSATLRDARKSNGEKIERLESEVARMPRLSLLWRCS